MNRRLKLLLTLLLALACPVVSTAEPGAASDTFPYLVGLGSADVTGPAFGVQLWGFGRPDQLSEGIHIRQRSRAFVIAEAGRPDNRLVFVSADLGSVDHHITLEVVERLQARFDDLYRLDNVIISATHNHSGPGGYWHSRSDTGLDGGLYPAHFEAVVKGISASIERAHNNVRPANILINEGRVENAGANRSRVAYLENPAGERARYREDTNTTMTLLKFVDDSGDIGMLNWYALHPTAMNYYNRLISGDHKGYASLQLERQRGSTYRNEGEYIAAFAQSDPGDVTPNMNLDNTGPGATDVETTQIMGDRQLAVAMQLSDTASEALSGPVDSRQVYVDLKRFEVDDQFTGAGPQTTCPSAYGYSFAGGSTEDGGGHFLFREGMTEQSWWRDILIRLVTGAPAWTQPVLDCQSPKAILFETGSQEPPLQSQIHSVTLARIGQLVIVAMPGEVTTMAGRRLRDTVMDALGDWAQHIVIAGYANGFAGYVTTPEEYELQQYEAAHNLHGRWTLDAYRQVATELAAALDAGAATASGIAYDDWRGKSPSRALPRESAPPPHHGQAFGEALPMGQSRFAAGDTVAAEFFSRNPTIDFPAGANFLAVERETPQGWAPVADDGDWSTRVFWRRDADGFIARLEWDVPENAPAGSYRLKHTGQLSPGEAFSGVSPTFVVGD